MPVSVPTTKLFNISPLRRASRPITNIRFSDSRAINVAKAEVNFTISMGVRPSPIGPPMVPRIPDIDLIKLNIVKWGCKGKVHCHTAQL